MQSFIEFNGIPMVWVSVDENPKTGELEAHPATEVHPGDILVAQFDGTIPADFWRRG